jgi:hypothetical protein
MARATASARRPRRCHRRQNRCRHKRNRHSRSRSGRTPCCPERGPRDNNRRNTRPPRHRPCRTRRPRNVCSSSSSRPCRCRPTCLRSAAPSARARPAAAASARPAAAASARPAAAASARARPAAAASARPAAAALARARPAAAASAPAPSLGSPNRRSCSRRRTRSVRRCPYPWRSSAARRSRRSGTATGGSYSCPRSCRSYRTRHLHSVCFCCRCRPPPAGGSPTLRCRAGAASWRPLCLLPGALLDAPRGRGGRPRRSSEVAARAPARGGRRRRGRSFSQSEADNGRSAVSAAPSARVPPAGSVAAPGLPRRRGSRSAMIRGGRGSARPRAARATRIHKTSKLTRRTAGGRASSSRRPPRSGP